MLLSHLSFTRIYFKSTNGRYNKKKQYVVDETLSTSAHTVHKDNNCFNNTNFFYHRDQTNKLTIQKKN